MRPNKGSNVQRVVENDIFWAKHLDAEPDVHGAVITTCV